MKKRVLAGTVSASLVASVVMGAAAGLPSASATTTTNVSYSGSVQVSGNPQPISNTYTDTITMTTSPSSPTYGTNITTTLSGSTGPIDLDQAFAAGTVNVRATMGVNVSSGSGSNVLLYSSGSSDNYPAVDVPAGTAQGAWSISQTWTLSGWGTVTTTVSSISFDDGRYGAGTGLNRDRTYTGTVSDTFTATGPAASIATSSGQDAGVQAARFSSSYATTIGITGTGWGLSRVVGSYLAELCDVSGSTCDSPRLSASLSTNSSGVMSGTVSHGAGSNPYTTGARTLHIFRGGGEEVYLPVTVLADPTVSVSPAQAAAGTTVSVSGSNFNPGQIVKIYGSSSSAAPYADDTSDAEVVSAATSSTGALSATSFTVGAASTTRLVAYQGVSGAGDASNPSGSAAFASLVDSCTADTGNVNTGSCDTSQVVNATLTTGALSQAASAGSGNPSSTQVVFCQSAAPTTSTSLVAGASAPCAMAAPTTTTSMFGSLNPITVVDTRGGSFGWSLTARMTDLSDGATGSMPASRMSISPSCSGATGSASGASAGAAGQTFASTVGLCTKNTTADSAGGTSGGTWTVSAPLTLSVPAYQAAGSYTSVITINLS